MGTTFLTEKQIYGLIHASQKLGKQESDMEYLEFSNKHLHIIMQWEEVLQSKQNIKSFQAMLGEICCLCAVVNETAKVLFYRKKVDWEFISLWNE